MLPGTAQEIDEHTATTARFALGGETLAIHAPLGGLGAALTEMFHLCPRSTARPSIELHAHAAPPRRVGALLPAWLGRDFPRDVPPNEAVMAPAPARQSACVARLGNLRFYAWASEGERRIDLVCEARRADDVPIIQPVLNPVLRDVLAWRSHTLVHAALVASASGVGQMIVAPSGGGKTTTALAVVRAGGRLIADDLVVIASESTAAASAASVGYGIPKLLNLRAGTLEFFAELKGRPDARQRATGERRTNVSPLAVYGAACLAPSHPIGAIYFTRLTRGAPAVRRLGVAEALARLIRAHAFSKTQRTDAGSTMRLTDVLSRTSAYALDTGPDPAALGDWLTRHAVEHATGRTEAPCARGCN